MEKLTYETIKKYQSFQTIEEMDQAVRGFLYKHKAELSKGTLAVLKLVWKHSVKVIGVSFAKYEYIAEQLKVSRRTVIRAINHLMERGILKKVPTVRSNGKQGVNVLVIQSYVTLQESKMSPHAVTLDVTPNKTENKQSSLCEKKDKDPRTTKRDPEPSLTELDSSYLPEFIPQPFIEAATPFFQAADIFMLWKRVLHAYRRLDLNRPIECYIDQIVYAFKQSVFAKKLGRIHTSFEGYFYRTVQQYFIVEWRNENKGKWYDFLKEDTLP